jgi:hypothetical protein
VFYFQNDATKRVERVQSFEEGRQKVLCCDSFCLAVGLFPKQLYCKNKNESFNI